MKKALMYLLLAVGIFFAVLLIGGALVGFIAGYIDGYNDQPPGTTHSGDFMNYAVLICLLLIGVILHMVFLGLRFSSYSMGRIPKGESWKVILLVMIVMGGMALASIIFYNPLTDSDTTLFETDGVSLSFYGWIYEHPFYSIPLIAFAEATFDLILFGGILREILEWKHRPQLVIGIFALLMGIGYFLVEDSMIVVLLSMVVVIIEGWTYECTRSVIPIVIGDSFFWAVTILMMGNTFAMWYLLPAAVMVIPAVYYLIKVMDPYKPID